MEKFVALTLFLLILAFYMYICTIRSKYRCGCGSSVICTGEKSRFTHKVLLNIIIIIRKFKYGLQLSCFERYVKVYVITFNKI